MPKTDQTASPRRAQPALPPAAAASLSPRLRRPGRDRGQALMIAVLVLFAVAALAALFAAIIGSQVAQTGRYSDVVQLRSVAESGLRLANFQLTYGMDGADWRPATRVFRIGGGEVKVDLSYGPLPTQLQNRFLRIVASATRPDNPFLRHTMGAYKPLLLTDYARFITDRFQTNQPASLGVSGVELGGSPRDADHGGPYLFQINGPIRSNTDLLWYGLSRVNLYTRYQVLAGEYLWQRLGLLRDDRIEVSGRMVPDDVLTETPTILGLSVNDTIPLRATNLFQPAVLDPVESSSYLWGFPDSWLDPNRTRPDPQTQRVLADLPAYPPDNPDPLLPASLALPRIRPPEVDAVDPDLQTNRYLLLTRDSGEWRAAGTDIYNTGRFGWGWADFGGIYIENTDDVQYGHDLEKLRLNWLHSVGDHSMYGRGGDQRGAGPDGTWSAGDMPPTGPADWWDQTGRSYAPPGVEIVLHGDADCPYLEIIRDDVKYDAGAPYWWQSETGMTLVQGEEGQPYFFTGPSRCPGAAQKGSVLGPRAIFPFPPNGIIYAEGNVRIRGVMPPVYAPKVLPTFYLPLDAEGKHAPDYGRRFDLQVVSGATIYIEGDLLACTGVEVDPATQAVVARFGRVPTTVLDYEADARRGSRIALLARDSVCVNTTAFHPRPLNLAKTITVTDSEEKVTNYLYNDAQPHYPVAQYPRYALNRGAAMTPEEWGLAGEPWVPTVPANIAYTYRNVRLTSPTLKRQLTDAAFDLRLIIGHAGWYLPGAPANLSGATAAPGAASEDQAGAAVRVSRAFQGQPQDWDPLRGSGDTTANTYYTFLDVTTLAEDVCESNLWYILDSTGLPAAGVPEFLPAPAAPLPARPQMHLDLAALTGQDDEFAFLSEVMPVAERDDDDNPIAWIVAPDELGYLLGPVAVAPPRGASALPLQIQALIYAQNGSFFILPGPWFNEDPAWNDYASFPVPGYHEPLNLQLSFYGAISENMPAPPGAVSDWTSKWSGPFGAQQQSGPFLTYTFDPLLRMPRLHRVVVDKREQRFATPRFPSLPMTPDLVVWGERVTGQAGS